MVETRTGKSEIVVTDPHPSLPLDASTQIEVALTEGQIEQFRGLLELASLRHGSFILMGLASSYIPSLERGSLRIQAQLISKAAARKIIKIIRAEEMFDQ